MINKYNEMLVHERSELENVKKTYSLISLARLITFFVAVVAIFVGIQNSRMIYTILGIVMVIVFIAFVKLHSTVSYKTQTIENRIGVLENYLKRYNGEWRYFVDTGEEFLNKDDTLAFDLDLLGKNSLYQLLSVAVTDRGRKKLADTLSLKKTDINCIAARNAAINELTEKNDIAIEFETLMRNTVSSKKKNIKEKREDSVTISFVQKMFMILLPVMNIAAIVLIATGELGFGFIFLTYIVSLCITYAFLGRNHVAMYPFIAYTDKMTDYYKVLELYSSKEYESEMLNDIKQICGSNGGAIAAMKKLMVYKEFYNMTMSPVWHFLLNGFFGWDFFIAFLSAKWSKEYEAKMLKGLEAISELEELISLSVLGVVRNTSKPMLLAEDKEDVIETEELVHPLIDPDKVVSNSVRFSDRAIIITGSNMSGKTTFLRSLAVNLALCYMGANCTAKLLKAKYMKIFSSMRVMDDTANGISTFYAEILRIKEMSEYLKDETNVVPAICFIDEIFKGTNSADRIIGATRAIEKLTRKAAFVLVSTHDFELCNIKTADGSNVVNYHFEEYYEDDALKFDYTIRNGECKTRNALEILKMAGLSD